MRRGRRFALGVAPLLVGTSVGFAARDAHAELSMKRFPAASGCEEASAYDATDPSAEAERARRRCRLEGFAAWEAERRSQRGARDEAARIKRVEQWAAREDLPVRVGHPLAVDLFVSGGIAKFGVAASWLLARQLELEGWIATKVDESSSWADVMTSFYASASFRCGGARVKWLFLAKGNFSPFAGLGGAFCSGSVSGSTYTYTPMDFPSNQSTFVAGDGKAHFATLSAGLTLTTEIGLRFSLEYLRAWAFYTQASLDQLDRPHDESLRVMWAHQMDDLANAVRFQVGYAF